MHCRDWRWLQPQILYILGLKKLFKLLLWAQEASQGASPRLYQFPQASRAFYELSEGSTGFQMILRAFGRFYELLEGSSRFQKVLQGSRRFYELPEGSETL
jgi:hypothetical protein